MKRPAVMNLDDLMSGSPAAEIPAAEQMTEPQPVAQSSVEAQTSTPKPVEIADVEPEEEDTPATAPARKPLRKATPETFRTSMYFARSVHDKVLKTRGRPSLKELRKKDRV